MAEEIRKKNDEIIRKKYEHMVANNTNETLSKQY